MTGRRTVDYVKVLQKIGRLLDREVEVEEFVVDFEKAKWKAIRYVFGEDAKIHGCAFHWGQAVWRHVQAKGLATEYSSKRETYAYIRKLPIGVYAFNLVQVFNLACFLLVGVWHEHSQQQ
ncbi:hypothetical protein DPMN_103338 [Dreissena polymorpha]|uniref:MULE transposase domain-containing protein n=1 Tax=Dreissena polymorpha TaxID=45954 RepID=A0A9D4H9L4_DREPO|nr:hypothetical protein DPMN_103338 [Dreissena polymorpha]